VHPTTRSLKLEGERSRSGRFCVVLGGNLRVLITVMRCRVVGKETVVIA
jgi:hypothetical protein